MLPTQIPALNMKRHYTKDRPCGWHWKNVMDFLPEQKTAIETLDKNICVTAGAGSGKTTVLTERFLHILQTERLIDPAFSPDNVLTLTFSEEAANEMKRRIAEGLERRGLEDLVPELEKSYLSTIHAFCHRLLKENVFEAGLDPEFTVLDGIEANLLFKKTLESLFQKLYAAKDQSFFMLISKFSIKELKESLLNIYNKIQSYDLLIKNITPEPQSIAEHIEKLLNCAEILASEGEVKITPGIKKRIELIQAEIMPAIQQLRTRLLGSCPAESALQELAELKISKSGIRDENYKSAIDDFKQAVELLSAIVTEQQALPYVRAFQDVLDKFASAIDYHKRKEGLLDFDSLQTEAKKLLLKHSDLKELYQQKFKYVLVDEYQDTNCLQDHLIGLISEQSKLFIVGDRQQAIYGFRNADDRLLLKKETDCRQNNQGLVINLQTNFRSTDRILEYINSLFNGLWQDQAHAFKPLQAVHAHTSNTPAVEIIMLDEEKPSAFIRRYHEANQAVTSIQKTIDEGLQYKDIAVLFRALSSLAVYEQAFKKANIPYTIVRSGSFYNQQEIIDIHNFFKTVLNPFDNFMIAQCLKSPLADISDNALFELINNPRHSLFEGLQSADTLALLSASDRVKAEQFLLVLAVAIKESSRISLIELLKYIISETEFINYLLLQNKGREKAGNMDKLLQIALRYAQDHGNDLQGFTSWMEQLINEGVKESEVTVAADADNSVKIFTVHKAKGLEFPMVILPDLERGILHNTGSLPFNLTPVGSIGCKLEKNKSFTYLNNEQQLLEREQSEAQRLFYVACTRAKDRLVFIGVPQRDLKAEQKKNPGWGTWLSLHGQLEQVSQKPLSSAPVRADSPPAHALWHQHQNQLRQLEPINISNPDPAQKTIFANMLRQILPPTPNQEQKLNLSVTQIMQYEHCPQYYYLRYIKGVADFWLAEAPPPALTGQPEEFIERPKVKQKDVPREQFGSIVHDILKNYDFTKTVDRQWSAILEAAEELSDNQLRELKSMLEGFSGSNLYQLIQQSAIQREISFTVATGEHLLHGVIDLLLTTPQGQHIIIDYKTNKWAGADLFQKSELAGYKRQQLLYALALRQITGSVPQQTILYFLHCQQELKLEVTETVLAETQNSLTKAMENIAKNIFNRPSAVCGTCKYESLCPKD
ncbi:UvrD-helicase domain-containing protein [Candidatus Margulisiibacteriota bacterium]